MSAALGVRLQYLLPKNLISAALYRIARSRRAWIRRPLIRWFANHFGIDMSEARIERLEDYETFNAFFTRELKAGARAVDTDARSVVSPVDGDLTQFGALEHGRLMQAKGLGYTLDALLGEPAVPAGFDSGRFATLYLAPRHYHRVHAPFAGRLVMTRYIPGTRFSVNRATAAVIERLFCRNERVVLRFEAAFGDAYVVLVGALNVSSISTAALGEIASGPAREWRHEPAVAIAKGDELGRFNLGSTVIVILPAGVFELDAGLADGDALSMGERLGRLHAAQ